MTTLDSYEQEIVRFLADQFNRGKLTTTDRQFPRASKMGNRPLEIRQRFIGLGWVNWDEGRSSVYYKPFGRRLRISPGVLEVVHAIDNPPINDYRKQVTTWFFSKPWSIPFWIALGLGPYLYGCFSIVWDVFSWISG